MNPDLFNAYEKFLKWSADVGLRGVRPILKILRHEKGDAYPNQTARLPTPIIRVDRAC